MEQNQNSPKSDAMPMQDGMAQQSQSSNTMMYVVIGIVVLIIIAILVMLFVNSANSDTASSNSGSNTENGELMEDDAMEKDGDAMEKDGDAMEKDGDAMEKDGDTMEKDDDAMMDDGAHSGPGDYVDYDAALLSNADDGDVVLFFHATWCPTCKILNDNLTADMGDIPADLTILRTDYDMYTELKQKYGVTYQHTLVQVDSDGNEIKQWSGSYELQDIVDEVV